MLRLDASGNRLWETNCGGADSDYLTSLLVKADGGCIAAGGSNSGVSGNKSTPNRGSTDFWLVSLDAQGKRLWEKTVGGTDTDALVNLSIAQAADGALVCGGDSFSGNTADKSTLRWGDLTFGWSRWGRGQPLRLPASKSVSKTASRRCSCGVSRQNLRDGSIRQPADLGSCGDQPTRRHNRHCCRPGAGASTPQVYRARPQY